MQLHACLKSHGKSVFEIIFKTSYNDVLKSFVVVIFYVCY